MYSITYTQFSVQQFILCIILLASELVNILAAVLQATKLRP